MSSVIYKILNDRLIIELEKCALIQNQTKDIFMLNENAKHEGLRKIYSGQVITFFDMPFTHLKIEKNTTLKSSARSYDGALNWLNKNLITN